jgi:hypothetical protein
MAGKENLQILPLNELTDPEIADWQAGLSDLLAGEGVRTRLRDLHLPSVLARHIPSYDGAWTAERGLLAARAAMNEGRGDTLLLVRKRFTSVLGYLAGIACTQPDVPLHEQRLPLPSVAARRLPGMTKLVFPESVGIKISVWLDPATPNQLGNLRLVYGTLQGHLPTDKMPWTILPTDSVRTAADYSSALVYTGFEPCGHGYYDDHQEGAGRLPKSHWYIPRAEDRGLTSE